MNYARDVLAARQRRDATIEQAGAEAKRKLAAAVAARDAEIHRLHAEDPSLSCAAIGSLVGCSHGIAFEILNPDKHEAYAKRRRAHWHVYRGGSSGMSTAPRISATLIAKNERENVRPILTSIWDHVDEVTREQQHCITAHPGSSVDRLHGLSDTIRLITPWSPCSGK